MGREGSGGTPIDDAPRDGRKNTDVRSVPNANAKSSTGSTPAIEGDAKLASGYERIEADKPKTQEGETPQDPAAPSSPGHIPGDGAGQPSVTPLPGQGVKR
jgi:hypothetical protein